MSERKKTSAAKTERLRERGPYPVRLPGFISDEQEVGLGEVITRAAYRVGIRPCAGCGRRAAALNKWVVFRR
jgi:hypothetical protein